PATGIEAIPDPLDPVMPEDIPAAPLALQFETGAGLKPPGSISVAPSGIPVALFDPLDALEPNTPSGDVVPRLDVLIPLCAWAASGDGGRGVGWIATEQDGSRYEGQKFHGGSPLLR